MIPYREGSTGQINRRALEIMTRDGVELWPVGDNPAEAARLIYHPSPVDTSESDLTLYEDRSGVTHLNLRPRDSTEVMSFALPGFSEQLLHAGRRFSVWPVSEDAIANPAASRCFQHCTLESFTTMVPLTMT